MAADDTFLRELFAVQEDARRCQTVLLKLAQQLTGGLMLTGGLAYGWHLQRHGREMEKRSLNDIDLVIADLAAVSPSISEAFLVSHFHPTRGRGKILLQLVDARERVRIDLFTPFSPTLMSRVHRTERCGVSCGMIAAEDLTARLLAIVYDVTIGKPVDPKYYDKFCRLSEFIDLSIVRDIWPDYRKPDCPRSFDEAAEAVRQTIGQTPDLLRPEVYGQPGDSVCPWCCVSEAFSVSPPTKIFAALGYV